jgi:hypothetical protein
MWNAKAFLFDRQMDVWVGTGLRSKSGLSSRNSCHWRQPISLKLEIRSRRSLHRLSRTALYPAELRDFDQTLSLSSDSENIGTENRPPEIIGVRYKILIPNAGSFMAIPRFFARLTGHVAPLKAAKCVKILNEMRGATADCPKLRKLVSVGERRSDRRDRERRRNSVPVNQFPGHVKNKSLYSAITITGIWAIPIPGGAADRGC